MSKSTRIVKRLLALFLVVLMSIESFGAVVSDNDGSAFITKAEFDSLKNNFQSQIDNYNTSIDSKIDGAIASYLAGINVSSRNSVNIIYSGWKEYVMMNGALAQEYKLPDLAMAYSWMHNANFGIAGQVSSRIAHTNHQYHEQGSAFGGSKITAHESAKKNVVDVYLKNSEEIGYESDGLDLTKHDVVWKGQGVDWTENVDISKFDYIDGYNNSSNELPGASGLTVWFLKAFSFVLSSQGYQPGGLNFGEAWAPKFKYTSTSYTSGRDRTLTTGWSSGRWTCSVNTYAYDHVGTFGDNDTWELSVPTWTNTFRTSNNSNITSKSLYQSATQYSRGGWIKDVYVWSTDQLKNWVADYDAVEAYWKYSEVFMPNSVTLNFTNSDSVTTLNSLEDKVPQIGLAGTLQSNQIKQTRDKVKFNVNATNSYDRDPLYLNEGYPLLYAKKDTIVEWAPIFKEVKGTGITNADEVNIVFTYDKFVDGIECNNKYITKDNDTSATNMIWTTRGLTTSIKFTMPEDGFVIAKWYPGSKTAEEAKSVDWTITLDNENSNSIYVTDPT